MAHARPLVHRAQLRARREGPAALRAGTVAHRRRSSSARIPTPACPNEFGGYDEAPEYMAGHAGRVRAGRAAQYRRRLLRHDAGAHPRHRGRGPGRRAPRAARRSQPRLRLSGLEPLTMRRRTPASSTSASARNVTGSAKFAKLILNGDYEAALEVARQQVENGAQIIDVNMDEAMLDSKHAMTTFLNLCRVRARHQPRPDHDRLVEVVGHRGRAQVHPGQGHRQLDRASRRARPSSCARRRWCGATARR